MHASHQVADRRSLPSEHQLAGGGSLEAHLVLHLGGHHPVALPQAAIGVDQELGDDEQRQPLGAWACTLGAGQHQVDDVLGGVVLARGDEPLHPLQVPGVARHLHRLGGAGTHIGAGIRLGQHHGARPAALHHEAGQAPLLLGALLPDDAGEQRPTAVEDRRGVGSQQQLLGGPEHGGGHRDPSQALGDAEAVPSRLPGDLQRVLQLGG